jgi:hypothetical protein
MGNDGELLDPEQVAKNTIILNKAWNNLSSKNKNTRLQAVRQLLISTQDENGNQLDLDQVDAYVLAHDGLCDYENRGVWRYD